MAYNTKAIRTDVNGNPISQYYNPETDEYEPVEGASGGNKVIIYNEDGTPNNSLNFGEILDKLDQLTGTVIAEQTRQQNEAIRQQNEQDRIDLYNALKDLDVSQYELRLQKLEHDTSVEEFILEEAYGSVISLPSNAVNGQISEITLKGITLTNSAKNGSFEDDFNNWMRNTIDSTIVIDTERALFGNKSVKIITNNNSRYITQNIDGSIGDKFYVSVWCRKESGGNALAAILPKGQFSGAILTIMTVNDFNNMPTGEWRRFSGIAEATNDGITILFGRVDNTTYEVNFDGIVVINMTQLGIEDYTKEQMDSIVQNYFEGTKSTLGAIRLKSVGKNLFDGEISAYLQSGNIYFDGSQLYFKRIEPGKYSGAITKIKTEIGKTYILSWKYISGDKLYLIRILDKDYNLITSSSISPVSFTATTEETYILFTGGSSAHNGTILSDIQVEKGITATEYEPYKESTLYILGRDEEGNILELRSLPNGTKDEINVVNRKLIKRIGEKANVSSGTVINYTDMTEGGTYYAWNENGETETGTKGDTLGIDATVLIYQLANPIEIPVEVFGNLQSYENGTVYVDAIIPRVDFYTPDGIYLENEPSIKEIDSLYLVNKENGLLTPLDISKASIFPDGKGFTHPDLFTGALVDWDYVPDVESTNPAISMKLPTNLKASINNNIKKIGDLSDKVDNLNIRMVAVHKNIQDLQNESNEHKKEFNEHKEEFNRYKQIYVPSNIVSRPMRYIAHRGASAIAPENTIPAYELAGQLGFWGVEADAIVTKDGVWVAFHDTNVERMTNGSGNIQEMTFAEVQNLKIDAGANVNYYPDQKIPTIEEFLNICVKWELVPIIEVKGNMDIENAQSLIELIQSKGLIGKVIISSLQLSHLTTIREINKEVFVEYATFFDSSTIDIIKSLGNAMLSLGYRRVNESIVRQCGQNNIILSSFTINDYNIAKSFEQLGISQIYTDILC